MLSKVRITSIANTNAINEKIRYALSEEDNRLIQNFFYTSFNQNKKYKEKELCKYSIISYTTTVSDAYCSFHFIAIFSPENSKQLFLYKWEFKAGGRGGKGSYMENALPSTQANL